MNKKKKRKPQHYITRWDGIRIPIYFESIDIDESLGKRRKLNVIIEEITHAFFFDEPEYKVRKYSAELGRIIYNRFMKQNAIENFED